MMRILMMATGDIAIPCLQYLIESDLQLIGLVTQPDKPVGRKQLLTAPRIKLLAQQHHIPILQPNKVHDIMDEVKTLQPDIILVFAYGQILPQIFIDLPSNAIINIHASLLPKYRGASCLQAAIDNGDSVTGITIMHVIRELDAGDIILQDEIPIDTFETADVLHEKIAQLAPKSLHSALKLLSETPSPRQQQNTPDATYAPKLLRDDGLLNVHVSAQQLERRIRAYHSWPGTYTFWQNSQKRIKIFPPTTITTFSIPPGTFAQQDEKLYLGTKTYALELSSVQLEGSKAMKSDVFLHGNSVTFLHELQK